MSKYPCKDEEHHSKYHKSDGSCYICTLVAEAPPLTAEQRHKIAMLLPPVEPEPAADEFRRAAAEDARRSRQAQGLPPTITDPVVVARIAGLLRGQS